MLARGYSFTELLIALAAGAILVIGAARLSGSYITYSIARDRHLAALEESLLLQRHIYQQLQRAGYQSASITARPGMLSQPFLAAWRLGQYTGEPANSCVLFAYDLNKNGIIDSERPNEQFGLRLHDGALESRMGGKTCEQSGWQDLSSAEIHISRFRVQPDLSDPALIQVIVELYHLYQPDRQLRRQFSLVLPNYGG